MKNPYKLFGFEHIPGFFSGDEISEINLLCERIRKEHHKEGYYEPSVLDPETNVLVRMEKILDLSTELKSILVQPKVMSLIKECLGEDGVLFKDKINFKPPGNRADLLHQDQNQYH